ncbi:MAG: acyl-CoA dehydrogenase, partial [Propionibacteriales bacterium]|nr:acyl-CoA dehydrogenase [Propionibacteriales bacterium]
MDFEFDEHTRDLCARLEEFMADCVYPAESAFAEEQSKTADPFATPSQVKEELKREARQRGLWNLFLPDERWGAGLTNLQYAPLAEITGRSSDLAPEAVNCSPPDTGNMELLAQFGTQEQQERWLVPLLNAEIRSCFSMTEPDVASSDASNISTRITRDGDEYVINGRKWWSTGALGHRCALFLVMGVSDEATDPHRRHSIVLVPRETPGLHILRSTSVFGYDHASHGGHAEILFDDVRVPQDSILGEPGAGFSVAQARLGPGRIHHCMRLLGQGERALELMCRRAHERTAFGKTLAEQGVVQQGIAESRVALEQARLLVLKAAWMMDKFGNKSARTEISAIKAV